MLAVLTEPQAAVMRLWKIDAKAGDVLTPQWCAVQQVEDLRNNVLDLTK